MSITSAPTVRCATCEAAIPGPPVIAGRRTFCCQGCVAGGPCICSYDREVTAMTNLASVPRPVHARWPMTEQAWRELTAELEELRAEVQALAFLTDDGDGLVDLRLARATRRLDQLADVLAQAAPVADPDGAVIGRRVTLLDGGDEPCSYLLVCPGQGDPAQGWVAADSPLGSAMLGTRAGDTVEVAAPAGRRRVTVAAVD
jgi:transcription elongation GreA/GreB family factor